MDHRDFDIVLLGVTGFTGKQVAEWFAQHVPRTEVRWALAARDETRLVAVRTSLGPDFDDLPVIVVDTLDESLVASMVRRTRVVLTTVGPYARFGDLVVEACVEHKTDYVDITGEVPWVRRVIDRHHDRARADGTRIVPFCGFDSIPSDLGTWMVVRHLRQAEGQGTRMVRGAFRARGGFNGGTLASAINLVTAERARDMMNPYGLNPASGSAPAGAARSKDLLRPVRDPDLGWVAPFLMAPVNTRVVRRSEALTTQTEQSYGVGFAYQEAMAVKGPLMGWMVTMALGIFPVVARSGLGRWFLDRFGPRPGEGPSVEAMDGGFFRLDLVGEGDGGARVRARVVGQGDPGNRCTVQMLCESALCLVVDREDLPNVAGVLTPSVAFGDVLLKRLRASGMVWEIQSDSGPVM